MSDISNTPPAPAGELMSTGGGGDTFADYIPFQDYTEAEAPEIASPPLPTDASASDAGAGSQEQQQGADAQGKAGEGQSATPGQDVAPAPAGEQAATTPGTDQGAAAAAAPPAAGDDPELTPEENRLVNAQPEAERPALSQKLKTARFEDHLTSPTKPKAEVRDYLKEKYPSDYAEFRHEVVKDAIADTSAFAADLFARDKEAYSKLAAEVYRGNPEWFLREATGRDGVTPETLTRALDLLEKGGGQSDQTATALSDEEIEDMREFYPEYADKLKAAKEAAATKQAEAAPAADQQAKPGDQQPKPLEAEALKPEDVIKSYETAKQEKDQLWEAAVTPISTYVEKKMDDRMGAAPTKAELESAPQVAWLKTMKRRLFLMGEGDSLPGFQTGFVKWAEHRKDGERDFDASRGRIDRYVSAKERDNAVSAANELLPFADKYFDERLRHPAFKVLDDLIELAKKNTNVPAPNEQHIPGSTSAGSQIQPTTPEEKFSSIAENF